MFGTWLVSLEFYEAGVEDSVATDERCASGNEGLQQELVKTWAEEVGGGGEKEIITKVGSGRVCQRFGLFCGTRKIEGSWGA